jgi:hypothetical protein
MTFTIQIQKQRGNISVFLLNHFFYAKEVDQVLCNRILKDYISSV